MHNDQTGDLAALAAEINTAEPLRKIRRRIEDLPLSADIKALLLDLAQITVQAGRAVLQIGRKILTVVFDILGRFPNTTFGVVVSVAISLMIGSVPFIGALLAPFLGPLLVAFGLTKGMVADLANASWAGRIRDLEAKLARFEA